MLDLFIIYQLAQASVLWHKICVQMKCMAKILSKFKASKTKKRVFPSVKLFILKFSSEKKDL